MNGRKSMPPALGGARAALRSAGVLATAAASVLTLGGSAAAATAAHRSAADPVLRNATRWGSSASATHLVQSRREPVRHGHAKRTRRKTVRHVVVRSPRRSAAESAGLRAEQLPPAARPAPEITPASAAVAVREALAQVGKPYALGKTGPSAFDCSGLTQHAWQTAGVKLPRTSQQQANFGRAVAAGQIAPGDLVVYYANRSHVAIYIGSGQVVYASHPGGTVRTGGLHSMPINVIRRP